MLYLKFMFQKNLNEVKYLFNVQVQILTKREVHHIFSVIRH